MVPPELHLGAGRLDPTPVPCLCGWLVPGIPAPRSLAGLSPGMCSPQRGLEGPGFVGTGWAGLRKATISHPIGWLVLNPIRKLETPIPVCSFVLLERTITGASCSSNCHSPAKGQVDPSSLEFFKLTLSEELRAPPLLCLLPPSLP